MKYVFRLMENEINKSGSDSAADIGAGYRVKVSGRAKRMSLTVHRDASVVVTVPRRFNMKLVEKFLRENREWIEKHVAYFSQFKNKPIVRLKAADYRKYKAETLALAIERVNHFNQFYGFSYNSISVRNQKTCWGSCSAKKNLNFNYKILFLPEAARDYIIVHELCHLKELNHSKNFWDLVAKTVPDFKETKKILREWEMTLS